MAEPIPYRGPEPRRRRRRVIKISLIAIGILLFLLIPLPDPGMHVEHAWICAVSASERREVEWMGGITTGKSFIPSSLEIWMQQQALNHVHDWRSMRYAIFDSFGRNRGSQTSSAPSIHRFSRTLIPYYVKTASDEQLKAFVRIMQFGTEAEQDQAVSDACDLALEEMEKRP